MTKPTLSPESELLEILPMGGHVPLDTTEVRKKILDLIAKVEQRARDEEQKRIKEIIDMEYHRIMFVAYPYAGIQIRDLSNLKRAMFDFTKRGDKARTLLSEAVKLDLRERNLTPPTTNERSR